MADKLSTYNKPIAKMQVKKAPVAKSTAGAMQSKGISGSSKAPGSRGLKGKK